MRGPSHDTEQFRLFLKENDGAQQLALLCLNAEEVNITFFSCCSDRQNLFVALLILKSCIMHISSTTNLILH